MRNVHDEDQYLDDCTQIEPMALQEEFVRLPGDMAYWASRYATVYKLYLDAKLVRERVTAELKEQHRNRLTLNSKGRVTVDEVESAVLMDANYLEAKSSENALESEKVRLNLIVDALRAKRDMLISIGAHQRAEMQHDPVVRVQEAAARDAHDWSKG
jgi:hypothetical protein